LRERVTGAADELLDHRVADGMERAVLVRWRDDGPPRDRRACLRQRDLPESTLELTRVVTCPDDMEREVLEHPDPDAIAGRGRTVRAAEHVVVHGFGRTREPVAVERPVDDGRDPPAGDRVLAQLEQSGGHRQPQSSGAPSSLENAAAKCRAATSTAAVVGSAPSSPRSRASEVELTPGMPHGSIRSKSARSTVTLRAIPW